MDRQDNERQYGTQSQGAAKQTGSATDPAGGAVAGYAVVDIWTFVPVGAGSTDITGYSVEATDGGIGKVDEATRDAGSSYLIVDTGPWIFGKKVMLPAGVVTRLDPDEQTVYVDRSKAEIKDAPEYDPQRGAQDREYRDRLGGYYCARSAR